MSEVNPTTIPDLITSAELRHKLSAAGRAEKADEINARHRERMAEVIAERDRLKVKLHEYLSECDRLENADAELAKARENLRDRFAMAALAGEIASTSTEESAGAIARAAVATGRAPALHVAITCYELADAMLAAREGGGA